MGELVKKRVTDKSRVELGELEVVGTEGADKGGVAIDFAIKIKIQIASSYALLRASKIGSILPNSNKRRPYRSSLPKRSTLKPFASIIRSRQTIENGVLPFPQLIFHTLDQEGMAVDRSVVS